MFVDSRAMAVDKSVLVIMFCVLCQFDDSVQQIEFPAEIGSSCSSDERCQKISNSVCKDRICTCIYDYVPHPMNKSSCLPVAKNFNDPCEEQIQCTEPFGDNATCSEEHTCICKPEHHYVTPPSKCLLSKGLDETCAETSECYLPEDGSSQKIECDEKRCKCRAGYMPTPNKQSCKSSAVINIISITCLVGVWVLHLGV